MSPKFISAALSTAAKCVCVCTTPKQAKQKYALYNNILRLSKVVARGRSETKSTCTLYETEICQASLKFCNFCRTVNKPKLKGLGKREVIPLIDKQITDEQSQVLKAQIINAWKWMLKWIRKKVVFNLSQKYFFRFNKSFFIIFIWIDNSILLSSLGSYKCHIFTLLFLASSRVRIRRSPVTYATESQVIYLILATKVTDLSFKWWAQ